MPAGRRHDADVGLELERLLGLRLLARLLRDLLRGLLAAGPVPLLVVVARRAVPDRPVEVLRVERHRVLGLDRVHGQPPVQLLVRRREPGVAVRVELVGEARRSGTRRAPSCGAAGRRSRSARCPRRAPTSSPAMSSFARGWWMKRRLQLGEDLDVPLRRHALLRDLRVVRGEGRLAQLPGQLGELASSSATVRVRHEVAAVEAVAALLFAQRGIHVNRRHELRTDKREPVLPCSRRNHSTVRRRPSSRSVVARQPSRRAVSSTSTSSSCSSARTARARRTPERPRSGRRLDDQLHHLAHRGQARRGLCRSCGPRRPAAEAAATYACATSSA